MGIVGGSWSVYHDDAQRRPKQVWPRRRDMQVGLETERWELCQSQRPSRAVVEHRLGAPTTNPAAPPFPLTEGQDGLTGVTILRVTHKLESPIVRANQSIHAFSSSIFQVDRVSSLFATWVPSLLNHGRQVYKQTYKNTRVQKAENAHLKSGSAPSNTWALM